MIETESLTAVIIGAGHVGAELATSLRDNGWQGHIILVGEEPYLPYHRPSLSKAHLLCETTVESLLIKPRSTYERAGVELICGIRAIQIDPQAGRVTLTDGRQLKYDRLILTTGSTPRALPIPRLWLAEQADNFHYLRTLPDIDRLRRHFRTGMRLVIIGGSYIGLEVASAAIKNELKVTWLKAHSEDMARVTPAEQSALSRHRAAGVDIHTNTWVAAIEMDASGNAVSAIKCEDGSLIPADLLIVCIGKTPNVQLALQAGLAVSGGVLVDEFGQTSALNIYAAGDCTTPSNGLLGRRLRPGSVPNALEQARRVALSICAKPRSGPRPSSLGRISTTSNNRWPDAHKTTTAWCLAAQRDTIRVRPALEIKPHARRPIP